MRDITKSDHATWQRDHVEPLRTLFDRLAAAAD